MNDDPRTLRILLDKAQFDLSAALFALGEINTQLEAIAASVGANQRFVHLNRVTSQAAAMSPLSAVETAQAIPTSVTAQTPAGTVPASQTPQTTPSL